MKLTLFYGPLTCALVPYVLLTEAGADFEVQPVDSRTGGTRTPEFLELNPKHKVPVLVIDGEPLTENIAIQIWIARQFPQARLLPADPKQEIEAISLMGWVSSGIHPHLVPLARPQQFCDLPDSTGAVRRMALKPLHEDLALADELLAGRTWFFGHFTAPDAYFFWALRRAMTFDVDVSRYTHCLAHFERVKARPSVAKLLAYDQELLRAFGRSA